VAGAVVCAPTISLTCGIVAPIVIIYVAEIVYVLPDSRSQVLLYILMSSQVTFQIDRDRATIQVIKTIAIKASTCYFATATIREDDDL
jgi:hypothetical protein